MESDSTLPWVVLAISGFCFSLVSLAEASVVSVQRERVQVLVAQKISGAAALESLHAFSLGPAGALSSLKFLFFATSLTSAGALLIGLDGVHWTVLYVVAMVVLGLLGLIYIVARALARVFGERIALRVASPVHHLSSALRPALAMETAIARRVIGAQTEEASSMGESVPGELGRSIGPNGEMLDEREARMIRGVVGLDQTTAREIMVPRVDMVVAEIGTILVELVEQMLESGHSRIPVYHGDLDHIEGIAYSRDLLGLLGGNEHPLQTLTTGEVIRPALFIPESKTLEELLYEFQERQVHLAMVVDEYGGVSGLVTIEDLLEEIVGEIHDEFDVGEPEIEAVGDREFLMDARVSIDQLDELLHVAVEGDGFDTVGGFVYQRLRKIPGSGDIVECDGLKIEVVSTVGRRLKKLRVTRTGEGEEASMTG